MIHIPMKSGQSFCKDTITTLNRTSEKNIFTKNSILSFNDKASCRSDEPIARSTPGACQANANSTAINVQNRPIPKLKHEIIKGQKIALPLTHTSKIDVCMGWNILNPKCDIDVSAFMLNSSGKVIGDEWFVFYGQVQSPDGSTVFSESAQLDREIISIDLAKLNSAVSKIVFVLTINEALEKKLNFSMVTDAYICLMDISNNAEIVSFKMTDYYSNVTSMMIAELYLHNGTWKLNAIGNGVSRDLAGLCELYGVQTV